MSREFMKIVGAGPQSDLASVAELLCKEGYAVVPVMPHGKAPICTLNRNEKKKADEGRPMGHECGVKEYITQPSDARRIFTRLVKAHDGSTLNIGIVAHPSRIILIDCDQADEVAAFAKDWAEAEDDPAYLQHSPTVMTPGLKDETGEWVHKDGGHYYFGVPDGVELPVSPGYYKAPGGYDVKWGMSQSLAPPSIRPEGPYVPTGNIPNAPQWLVDRIFRRVSDHEMHLRAKSALVPNDSIAQWSIETSWAELLVPDGWTETFKSDNCGCPIFTRPGGGTTSWKSATGHNGDCPRYENVEQHGPLHIWSSNAPDVLQGRSTMTKLTYATLTRFGGDESQAMNALGLERARNEQVEEWVASMNEQLAEDEQQDGTNDDGEEGTAEEPDPIHDYLRSTGIPEDQWPSMKQLATSSIINKRSRELAEIIEVVSKRAGTAATTARLLTGESLMDFLDNPVVLKPTICRMETGDFLLYPGRLSAVAARPGTGKSWMSLATAAQVLQEGGKALILDFEDSPGLSVQRLLVLGVDVRTCVKEGRLGYADYGNVLEQADFELLMCHVENFKADFVAVDSANALISQFGAIEDNTLVTKVYRRLALAAERSGSAMLIIDHLPKNKENRSAIGAQAKQAALTGVFFMLDTGAQFDAKKEGFCVLSVHEKDRLGGVKKIADKEGRVALMRVTNSMVAPPGGEVWDGKTIAFHEVPEGFSLATEEEKAGKNIIEVITQDPRYAGKQFTRSEIRQAISSNYREKLFGPKWDSFIKDGYLEKVGDKPERFRWAGQPELEAGS